MLTENTKPVLSSETLPGHRLRGRPPLQRVNGFISGERLGGGAGRGGFTVSAGGCAVIRDVSTLRTALLL